MECKVCKENLPPIFDEDFINGECLHCRSYREYEEWVAKEAKQLERWNKKTGNTYDSDIFYYACDTLEVKKEELKGFPMLREIWEYAESIRLEYEYLDKQRKEPTLFDELEKSDLPF